MRFHVIIPRLFRANKDKENLDHKLKIAMRSTSAPSVETKKEQWATKVASPMVAEQMEQLRRKNYELEDQVWLINLPIL